MVKDYEHLRHASPEDFRNYFEETSYRESPGNNLRRTCTRGKLYVIARDFAGYNNYFLTKMFGNDNIQSIRTLIGYTKRKHYVNDNLNEIADAIEYYLKKKREIWFI